MYDEGTLQWDVPRSAQEYANLLSEIADEICLRAALNRRNYDSGIVSQNAAILDELRRKVALHVLEHARFVPRDGRNSRSEKRENTAKIMTMLRDYAFAMLSYKTEEQFRMARRQIDSGTYIAKMTGVRGPTVGSVLNLKGKNRGCNPHAQVLFEVCRDEEYFRLFEEFVKSHNAPLNNLDADQLALRLSVFIVAKRGRGECFQGD